MNKEYYGVKILPAHKAPYAVALLLSQNMRRADERELAAQKLTPFEGVYESILTSIESHYALYKGKVLCAFGIADTGTGVSVWMLASEEVNKHHRALIRCGMDFIADKLKIYHELYNYISLNNPKAILYIKHAGATLSDPVNVNGTEFVKFTIKE